MTDTPAPTLAGKDYFTQAEAAAYACVSLSQFRARADEYGIRPVLWMGVGQRCGEGGVGVELERHGGGSSKKICSGQQKTVDTLTRKRIIQSNGATVGPGKRRTDMSKTITANIPARSVKGQTKTFTYPARVETFACDAEGRWTLTTDGQAEALFEAEVVDICRRASNWADIKREHFPMPGCHS